MYTFTNQFSGPGLCQRVSMINSQRSGSWALWRYGVWIAVMGVMALACRHEPEGKKQLVRGRPPANLTQKLVKELEAKESWYRLNALFRTGLGTETIQGSPVVLHIKDNHFVLSDDHKFETAVYINGKEASEAELSKLSPERVKELYMMNQFENLATSEPTAQAYRIFIQTQSRPVQYDPKREQFFTFLRASAISKYPMGESFSFNMNQLLEATFLHNEKALVERTKNQHLRVYDKFANITDVSIDKKPATVVDVQRIHVREVGRLYTKERPYTEWFKTDNPAARFELFIERAPKRAKRDSSYYVFSPFYSGDF